MFGIGVSPLEWGGGFIVVADVAQEFGAEIRDRAEDAPRDDLALNFGEPIFDLVEPRGVGRGEVQRDLGMALEKGLD